MRRRRSADRSCLFRLQYLGAALVRGEECLREAEVGLLVEGEGGAGFGLELVER